MKSERILLTLVLAVGLLAVPALADWNLNDPTKMTQPMLPKVDGGWDVKASYYLFLADDWKCSETGYVNDIHTWVSFKGDVVVDPTTVHLAIWSDDPVGNGGNPGEDPLNTFSKPLVRLWHGDTTTWAMRLWDEGPQGWFDPREPGQRVLPPDHLNVYQMNFLFDDLNAFWQTKDTIYWLEFTIQQPVEVNIGWKQAASHFNDDAVWRTTEDPWSELVDPVTGASLDLAFVVTPEPATMALLALGGLAVLRRRR